MAKVLLYDKEVADSIFVSGILDKNTKTISYSENDAIKRANVLGLLKEFANKKVDFIIFTETEKEWMLNLEEYKNLKIIGTLDKDENMLLGVLDGAVSILKGTD